MDHAVKKSSPAGDQATSLAVDSRRESTALQCGRCGEPPAHEDLGAEDVVVRCPHCDAVGYAVHAQTVSASRRGPATPINPLRDLPHQSPRRLQRLIEGLIDCHGPRSERRQSPRHDVALPLLAMPLDSFYLPAGPAVPGTSKNLSIEGVSVLCERDFCAPYVLLDFSPCGQTGSQVVMKVLRQRQLQEHFEIAGTFLSRWTPS